MDLAASYHRHIETISAGVAAALERTGHSALLVHSGTPLKRTETDDQYWALRVTPHFHHWLPLTEPGCAVLFVPGKKPKLLRAVHDSFWEALSEPESDHFWAEFDVEGPAKRGELPPGRVAFVGDDLRAARELGLDSVNPPELLRELDQLRVHKTPYEVLCLAEANARAAKGHDELRRLFAQADHSELQLHLSFLGKTLQDDSETPYKNIVALGKHAATLHHITYEKRAQPALSMLVDAGASFCGYGSDITRTWVKGGGEAGAVFARIVSQMEAMQQRLCGLVKPGVRYEELHDESHRQVAVIIRDVGLSRLSEEELVAKKVTRAFYPHGLGHSLGVQVHDVGCGLIPPRTENPYLRNTTNISVGQVFTIEPGFYFIDALLQPALSEGDVDWTLIEALSPFGGVRIEDDLHVGPSGIRNLTREVLPNGGGPA
jgi:Xaa-Pro dipeptidase